MHEIAVRVLPGRDRPGVRPVCGTPGEAAPRTDEACTAPLPGASLPGASYLSQPRTFMQETTFENLAQLYECLRGN